MTILLCASCTDLENKTEIKQSSKNANPLAVKDSSLDFIQNKEINYNIVLMSCDTCAPITNIGYRVVVQLTDEQEKKIRKISAKKWAELLEGDSTDWASNLILHYINQKDAFHLKNYNSEKEWRKAFKQDDVEYWEKHNYK
ncbi:hypothetical protein [Fluviicola sp.]|uniref:hypothetical protein n=1 Tax=Fluviicola sp. TaxID=1917219 RepID=UPI00262DECAE|nr:hypothetical protein [Fluviicola sp.]